MDYITFIDAVSTAAPALLAIAAITNDCAAIIRNCAVIMRCVVIIIRLWMRRK